MKQNQILKSILSLCLAALFVAAPLGEFLNADSVSAYAAEAVEAAEGGAYVTFGKNMKSSKAEAILSDVMTNDNYVEFVTKEGRECIQTGRYFTSAGRSAGVISVPIKVDDDYIAPSDKKIAVTVTFFDHGYDQIGVNYPAASGGKRYTNFRKNGSNTWRTVTLLLRDPSLNGSLLHESDIYISASESAEVRNIEYISKVEIVNLDKTYKNATSTLKADVLHEYEANGLYHIGLLDGYKNDGTNFGLDKALTREAAVKTVVAATYGGSEELSEATCPASDVSEAAKPYVGLALSKGIITSKNNGTIGAQEIITLRELFNMFILAIENRGYRYLGDSTYETAKGLGLFFNIFDIYTYGSTGIRTFNQVPGFFTEEAADLERYAYLDDLAGITYNAMTATVAGNEAQLMAMLHKRGAINRDMLVPTGCGFLLLEFYLQTGFTIVEDSYVDKTTGVTVNTMSLPGLRTCAAYSHSCGSTADGKIFVLATGMLSGSHLVTYNRETKETKLINPDKKTSGSYMYMLCPATNEVIYTSQRELHVYDIDTETNRHVITQDVEMPEVWTGVPSITADGDLVALFGCDAETRHPMSIDTVNIRTGELTKTLTKEDLLALPDTNDRWKFGWINHVNINPVYKNLYSYVRENVKKDGITTSPPYEVWVYNSDTKEHHMVFRDHINPTTYTKDTSSSHYVWSLDGEKIYGISYWSNKWIDTLPGNGMFGVTKEGHVDENGEATGKITEWVNGDYAYNHSGICADDKYFIGDLSSWWSEDRQRYEGKVVLVDGETKKSRLLVDKMGIESSHPGHTHPLLSEDGSTAYFTMADDNYRLMAAYIDLTTLPEQNPDDYLIASIEVGPKGSVEKGIARYTEYPARKYYSPNWTEYGFIGGKSCIEIPKGNNNPFDVYPEYISYADNVVTMEIEYFDNGTDPITVEYNGNNLNETSSTARDRVPYKFNRTNTNTWKTHTFTVDNVSFRNVMDNFCDFRINAAASKTPIYIRGIRAAAGDKIPEVGVNSEGVDFGNTIKAFTENGESLISVGGNYQKTVAAPDGQSCVSLLGNQAVSFFIDESVEEKKQDVVSIGVTYYDYGKGSFTLEYNADTLLFGQPRSKDYKSYKITRGGTNCWKTEIVELTGADFAGRQADGADFRITSSDSSVPVYIRQVELLTD